MPLSYASNKYDIGSAGDATNLSKAQALFLCKPGTHFDTMALAAVKANWLTQIAAGNIIPILKIDEEEIKDSETNVTETSTGRTIKNFEGIRKRLYTITQDIDSHKKMRTFNGSTFCAYIGDMNGNIMGTSSDGTLFEPFTINYLDVAQQKTGAGYSTPVQINYADSTEWDSRGKILECGFALNSLEPVYPVTIATQTTVSATIFTVQVNYVSSSSGDSAGVAKSIAIPGLAKENFLCYNTAALTTPLTPSSAVESLVVPGLYVVTCATFTGGPCSIIPTVTNLYKSVAVTIVSA